MDLIKETKVVYRVIQWATGQCGAVASRAILDRADMELVGVRVFSGEKAGRDVGELLGIAPVGLLATDDEATLLALEAECILWMAQLPMDPDGGVPELCRMLASGKNVITIVHEYLLPPAIPDHWRSAIETACLEGQSTLHIAGMDPGMFNEVFAPQVASMCSRLDKLTVRELLDYSRWDSPQLLWFMGFGQPPRDVGARCADLAAPYYGASLHFIANALGVTIDEVVAHQDEVVAQTPFDVPAGHIAEGTVAAMRFGYTGMVDGQPRLVVEHINRLQPDLAPDWPDGRGYDITIEGDPFLHVTFEFGRGEDELESTLTATAMRAVNAIPAVCGALPGIRTALDLPLISMGSEKTWKQGVFGRMHKCE